MIREVEKFPLPNSVNLVQIPKGFRVIHVAMQGGVPTLWAEIDTAAPVEGATFAIFPDGQVFDDTNAKHVGSFEIEPNDLWFEPGAELMGHVYHDHARD